MYYEERRGVSIGIPKDEVARLERSVSDPTLYGGQIVGPVPGSAGVAQERACETTAVTPGDIKTLESTKTTNRRSAIAHSHVPQPRLRRSSSAISHDDGRQAARWLQRTIARHRLPQATLQQILRDRQREGETDADRLAGELRRPRRVVRDETDLHCQRSGQSPSMAFVKQPKLIVEDSDRPGSIPIGGFGKIRQDRLNPLCLPSWQQSQEFMECIRDF